MQLHLFGGETSHDIAKLIRREDILTRAREVHDLHRGAGHMSSCRWHMRLAVKYFNYADRDRN